jgi:hypothetical protein
MGALAFLFFLRSHEPSNSATLPCGTPQAAVPQLTGQKMNLPFTPVQFFAVFTSYNEAVWPMQFILVLVAIAMVTAVLRIPERADRIVAAGLALLWCWLALGYHLAFFWAINPAAPLFAAISLAGAGAFLWLGVFKSSLRFQSGMDARKIAGLAVIIFALAVYPAIGALLGHHYPAAPSFGLPCPTTIFTFGILLMTARPLPRMLLLAPMTWAIIGAFAALSLGVTQDFSLVIIVGFAAYMLLP